MRHYYETSCAGLASEPLWLEVERLSTYPYDRAIFMGLSMSAIRAHARACQPLPLQTLHS